jgi:hypothetical protein
MDRKNVQATGRSQTVTVYRSRRFRLWLTAFLAFELAFVLIIAAALTERSAAAFAGAMIVNIAFSIAFLAIVRKQRDLGRIWETDGATWIRAFGADYDVILRKPELQFVERSGFVITAHGPASAVSIDPDCTGYESLRLLIEQWAAARETGSAR